MSAPANLGEAFVLSPLHAVHDIPEMVLWKICKFQVSHVTGQGEGTLSIVMVGFASTQIRRTEFRAGSPRDPRRVYQNILGIAEHMRSTGCCHMVVNYSPVQLRLCEGVSSFLSSMLTLKQDISIMITRN